MKVKKGLIEKVLERLYLDYFPDTCFVEMLCDVMGMKREDKYLKTLSAICVYLKDKGLTTEESRGRWRITASGIDFLVGKSLIKSATPKRR